MSHGRCVHLWPWSRGAQHPSPLCPTEDSDSWSNPAQCKFNRKSITFLRHVIDKHGVSTNPGKTQAVREMERPANITELRRFLSMVNQLGKFSSKLSDLSRTIRSAQSSCTVGPDTGGIIQRHHVRAGT